MKVPPKRQVVVAYDFSEEGRVALERAIELAGWRPHHVLHVITAVPHGTTYERAEHVRELLAKDVETQVVANAPAEAFEVFAHARIGGPDQEILRLAEEVGADLVVIGSHDRGVIGRAIHGSVSEAVLRHARCPVMVARRKGYEDVTLQQITEVTEHHPLRPLPHRYSYSSDNALVR